MKYLILLFSLLTIINGDVRRLLQTNTVCPTGEKLNPNGVCAQICGGIAGLTCPNGYTCIDDPRDTCDPKNNGVDCSGFCHETPTCTDGTTTCTCDKSTCEPCNRLDGTGKGICSCRCDNTGACLGITKTCPQCTSSSE
eukprot:803687_1